MNKNSFLVIIIFSFIILVSVSCKSRQPDVNQRSPLEPAKAGGVVNLASWTNIVSEDVLKDFKNETGITVRTSNYSSNEELLAKLQAGASGYDIIVPSDYMVGTMVTLGLLHKLDRSQILNYSKLEPKLLGQRFDPKNEYSMPYDWGTTGIAINRSIYKGKMEGWQDLFETPVLKGKFTLLDDVRETLGAALKSQGMSLNERDPKKLESAKQALKRAVANAKGFNSEPLASLVNNEIAAAHVYSCDALQAKRQTEGKIEYIIPKEGGTFWIDCLAIPKSAANVEGAHRLINYMLSSQVNSKTVMKTLVAPANKDVVATLPSSLRLDRSFLPSSEMLKSSEMIEEIGQATDLWDRIWTEVKTSGN